MEHLRLLLPMVLSLVHGRADGLPALDWQEDPGCLYRAPEEGAHGGARAAPAAVDLDKKVCVCVCVCGV